MKSGKYEFQNWGIFEVTFPTTKENLFFKTALYQGVWLDSTTANNLFNQTGFKTNFKNSSIRPATLLKETLTQVLSCEYCKIFKKIYFEEHLREAASETISKNNSIGFQVS